MQKGVKVNQLRVENCVKMGTNLFKSMKISIETSLVGLEKHLSKYMFRVC